MYSAPLTQCCWTAAHSTQREQVWTWKVLHNGFLWVSIVMRLHHCPAETYTDKNQLLTGTRKQKWGWIMRTECFFFFKWHQHTWASRDHNDSSRLCSCTRQLESSLVSLDHSCGTRVFESWLFCSMWAGESQLNSPTCSPEVQRPICQPAALLQSAHLLQMTCVGPVWALGP